MCEKQGKINEAYKKLQDGWLSNGDKVPPAEFAKVLIFDLMSCFQYVGRANQVIVVCICSFKVNYALFQFIFKQSHKDHLLSIYALNDGMG